MFSDQLHREQQMLSKDDVVEHMVVSPGFPASSRAILELLLRQSLTKTSLLHEKLYSIIHCLDKSESTPLNGQFDDSDAAIFHNIDVVLSHYAPKNNRINPFSSWPGAGDKGNISKDCNRLSSNPLVDYYLTRILKMKPVQTDEGQIYRGGSKMKRGHKIASCLLRWAQIMQLESVIPESDDRASFKFDNSQGNSLNFDHERQLFDDRKAADDAPSSQHNQYTYFVSEVMRLMAARWREHGAKAAGRGASRQGATPRKRGRPKKLSS